MVFTNGKRENILLARITNHFYKQKHCSDTKENSFDEQNDCSDKMKSIHGISENDSSDKHRPPPYFSMTRKTIFPPKDGKILLSKTTKRLIDKKKIVP